MQFFAVVAMSIALLGYSKAVPLENAPRSSGLTPIYKTCHKDGLTALTMDDGVFKYVSFSSSLFPFSSVMPLTSSLPAYLPLPLSLSQHSKIQNTFDDAGVKASFAINGNN